MGKVAAVLQQTQREKLEAEARSQALAERVEAQERLLAELQTAGAGDKELIAAFDGQQKEQQQLLQELLAAHQTLQERMRDVARERTVYKEAFSKLTRLFRDNALQHVRTATAFA